MTRLTFAWMALSAGWLLSGCIGEDPPCNCGGGNQIAAGKAFVEGELGFSHVSEDRQVREGTIELTPAEATFTYERADGRTFRVVYELKGNDVRFE